jgi:peptide/nickel transport system permease protein
MWPYIGKRLLLMLPTLLGATLVIFLLMNIIPGDVAILIIGGEQGGDINPQELATLRAQLGLDRPLYVQFYSWLWGVVRLDFGTSLWTGVPILDEILSRLPLSLEVAIVATMLSTLLAIPFGTLAAIRQDTWVDYAIRGVSIGGLAIPSFWMGMLVTLFLVLYSARMNLAAMSSVALSTGRALRCALGLRPRFWGPLWGRFWGWSVPIWVARPICGCSG